MFEMILNVVLLIQAFVDVGHVAFVSRETALWAQLATVTRIILS